MKFNLIILTLLFSLDSFCQRPEISNCLEDTVNTINIELNSEIDTSKIGIIQLISGGVCLKNSNETLSVKGLKYSSKKNID